MPMSREVQTQTTPTIDQLPSWIDLLDAVLRDPDRIGFAFQPIVDLQRAVPAGFEVLSRFRSEPYLPPDQWFDAAAKHGRLAELEAAVLARILDTRPQLPPNCFLSLNVRPAALLDQGVLGTLHAAGSLAGVIIEITEQSAVDDYGMLGARLDRLRSAGAHLAVDDAGAGYASLRHIAALRPDFIKVDRALVDEVDRDPAKSAVIETLGTFGSRLDAWLIAEGIERSAELRRLLQLEVPLGQGYLLGRPAPEMLPLDPEVLELHGRLDRGGGEGVGALVELATTTRDPDAVGPLFDGDGEIDVVVVVDAHERPLQVHARMPFLLGESLPVAPLCVMAVARPVDVARRAMTREAGRRFKPVAIIDDVGKFIGVVRIERLVETLAARAE
jgi:EAL domain-containing protein (putative c-di-GMP-specific phosphodiesterase class I)